MSSSALMSIGQRAMFANYASMQTTGHNIANAQTPGYSRQTVELASSGGQYSGAGFFGKGVDVVTVRRANDQFLTAQAQTASSMAAMDDAHASNLQQLETVFPPGETGVGAAVGGFMNAFVDLASSPADSSTRQVILSDAAEVADRFATAGAQLDSLQSGVNDDLRNSVAEVNELASKVATLNYAIAGTNGTSAAPNDLLDQRDQLIKEIGKRIKVSTVSAGDGTMGVFIAGGQSLVLGSQAQQLVVTPDPANSSRSVISISGGGSGSSLQLSPDLLVGGRIAGLLTYQNDDLVAARNQLGQQAAALSAMVNQVQGYGIDMSSPAGAGNPLFAVGAPVAIPNANNTRNADGGYAATVALTVTDGSQLKASDYTLAADPATAGHYIVTRSADGVQFSMTPSGSGYTYTRLSDGAAMGSSMDGFQIAINGSPGANDTFELEPVGRAAVSMTRVLDDPDGLAAAAPMTAVMGTANKGTATVAGLNVISSSNVPSVSAAISFTDANGDYSYTLTDASGDVTASGNATWTAGQPIELNGFALALNGVPASGDTLSVVKTAHPESNNGNALAMVALRDATFVGRDMQLDGTLQAGETATDAYASALANVGVRVQSAETASTLSTATAQQADDAVASKTGVNLDEEAGRLIQYQQGYQAAAKVLQVAQAVFDTLLQIAAR